MLVNSEPYELLILGCSCNPSDFVRRLVAIGYVDSSVIDHVQARRDPPTHGIFGMQGGIGRGAGQPAQAQQPQQAPTQQQAPQPQVAQQAAPQQQPSTGGSWVWDDIHKDTDIIMGQSGCGSSFGWSA
jgi:hypothetical protein